MTNTINLFVKRLSKERDSNWGPLELKLTYQLSGLCYFLGIYFSKTKIIVLQGWHFLPLEKFPPSGNLISLRQAPIFLKYLAYKRFSDNFHPH